MLNVEKITRKKPKELDNLVELPNNLRECWFWFLSLNSTRSSGFGVSPITYTELFSYFSLMDIDIAPEEIEIIKMFDSIALEANKKHQEQEQRKKQKK